MKEWNITFHNAKEDKPLLQNQVNNRVTGKEQSRSATENVSPETDIDTEIDNNYSIQF